MKKALLFYSVCLLLFLTACGGDDEPSNGNSQSKLKGSWWLKIDQKIAVDEDGNEHTLWTERSRDYLFIFGDNGLMAKCWLFDNSIWNYRIQKYEYDKTTDTFETKYLYENWSYDPRTGKKTQLNSTEDRIDEIYKIQSISKEELILVTINDQWYEQGGKRYRDYHYMSFEKLNDKAALDLLKVEEIDWQYGYKSYE